jgi:hypothetical protein
MPPELYPSYIIQDPVYRLNVRNLVLAMTSLHQINGNLSGLPERQPVVVSKSVGTPLQMCPSSPYRREVL